jgi:hypothetical protein
MATKIETIAKYLVKRYKEDKPDSGYVIVNHNDEYELSIFEGLRDHARKYRMKSFHVKDIIPVDNNIVVNYHYGIKPSKRNKGRINSSDKTGIFKIEFSDGSIMYYAKWLTGGGKSRMVEGAFAAEESTWYKFLKIMDKKKKRDGTPKKGIYRVKDAQGVLVYSKIEKLVETPVVHQTTGALLEDMNYFYENTELFTRYGMPGVRKVMLVGEPGTGKSSISIRIANTLAEDKSVVFCTDIVAAAGHLQKCAKYNLSTLVVLEDAESTLSGKFGSGASSGVLNFLDGIDQPVNKGGAYVIMTTNYPQKIEPRIIKRPGRVDRIFKFGALEAKQAVACAKIYFKGILYSDKDEADKTKKELAKELEIDKALVSILDNDGKGMTGAQIKELAQSSVALAVSKKVKDVTVDIVREAKDRMEKDLKDVYEFANDDSMNSGPTPVGFGSSVRRELIPEEVLQGDKDLPF